MKANRSALLIVLYSCFELATTSVGDSTYSYVAWNGNSVCWKMKHFVRPDWNQGDEGFGVSYSTQNYSNYFGVVEQRYTFQRETLAGLSPGGKYFERYIWDRDSPADSVWLYRDYLSLAGDINPSNSSAAHCKSGDTSGCDYVNTPGERWLANVAAASYQGNPNSPAFFEWYSGNVCDGCGDIWYQGGVQQFKDSGFDMFSQIWKRDTWTMSDLRAYPDAVNAVASVYGWTPPGTSTQAAQRIQTSRGPCARCSRTTSTLRHLTTPLWPRYVF